MDEGKALIRFFCVPDKNGVRHYPAEAPDKWEVFKQYNKRDVEVEMAIQQKLSRFPVPEAVWDEYHLSEEINDRGILIDMPLVEQAVRIDVLTKTALITCFFVPLLVAFFISGVAKNQKSINSRINFVNFSVLATIKMIEAIIFMSILHITFNLYACVTYPYYTSIL